MSLWLITFITDKNFPNLIAQAHGWVVELLIVPCEVLLVSTVLLFRSQTPQCLMRTFIKESLQMTYWLISKPFISRCSCTFSSCPFTISHLGLCGKKNIPIPWINAGIPDSPNIKRLEDKPNDTQLIWSLTV